MYSFQRLPARGRDTRTTSPSTKLVIGVMGRIDRQIRHGKSALKDAGARPGGDSARRAQASASYKVDAVHLLGTQAPHPLSQGLGGVAHSRQRVGQVHRSSRW